MAGFCGCEFSNVGHHEENCALLIPLLKRLEAAKERVIKLTEFDAAAAIRDAIHFVRIARMDSAGKDIQATLELKDREIALLRDAVDKSNKALELAVKTQEALHLAVIGLKLIEENCPCGARPETLGTNPHVTNCLVEVTLEKIKEKVES